MSSPFDTKWHDGDPQDAFDGLTGFVSWRKRACRYAYSHRSRAIDAAPPHGASLKGTFSAALNEICLFAHSKLIQTLSF